MSGNEHPDLCTVVLHSPCRILVVEDEPATQFAYRKLIEREGMQVDVAATLDAALDKVRSCRYMAVITDLHLAGPAQNLDGLEVLRVARVETPETRLICTTAYGCDMTKETVRGMGVSHYFEKPVPPAEIIDLLKGFRES